MGFQFNHVGGGTKTRRPITLHMKYNSACVQPHCYLVTEEFGEQEVTLEELQVGQQDCYALQGRQRNSCGDMPVTVCRYLSCPPAGRLTLPNPHTAFKTGVH